MTETKYPAAVAGTVLRALRGRSFWVCLLALALAGTLRVVSDRVHLIYLRDDGVLSQWYTTAVEAEDILQERNILLGEADTLRFDGFSDKVGLIEIRRAFPVTLAADGETREILTTATTLADFLEKAEITLGEFDLLTCEDGEFLREACDVTVQRVELSTTVVTESIPYETITKRNSLLRNGRTRTLVEGTTGERVLTYVDRVVDGILQERELVKTVVTREPSEETVLVGSDDAVSPLDFGIALDANGIPTSYRTVLTNQVCTGYSGRGKKVHGASGMDLSAGYVAVRADEIPYGTRLYITSADNSFVYGFAIAADTGVALMNHVIDFDLFYDTYRESALNSRRICNVYVLD